VIGLTGDVYWAHEKRASTRAWTAINKPASRSDTDAVLARWHLDSLDRQAGGGHAERILFRE
jgi:hypothetical protein